jgi:hypothetical protein
MFYKVEISLQGDTVVLEENYIGFKNVPLAGNLILVTCRPPWASRPCSRGAT